MLVYIKIGPTLYAFCDDHFARAIEQIFPRHIAEIADPETLDGLTSALQCAWCKADKHGRDFAKALRRPRPQQDPDSFLEI